MLKGMGGGVAWVTFSTKSKKHEDSFAWSVIIIWKETIEIVCLESPTWVKWINKRRKWLKIGVGPNLGAFVVMVALYPRLIHWSGPSFMGLVIPYSFSFIYFFRIFIGIFMVMMMIIFHLLWLVSIPPFGSCLKGGRRHPHSVRGANRSISFYHRYSFIG